MTSGLNSFTNVYVLAIVSCAMYTRSVLSAVACMETLHVWGAVATAAVPAVHLSTPVFSVGPACTAQPSSAKREQGFALA